MCRHEQSCPHAVRHFVQQRSHGFGVLCVERRSRLVGDQQARLDDQSAGDGGALRFTLTEFVRPCMRSMRYAQALERHLDRCFVEAARLELLRKFEVCRQAQRRHEPQCLEDDAQIAATDIVAITRAVSVREHFSIDLHSPAVRSLQPADDVEQRRLARAGGTEQQGSFSLIEVEIDVAKNGLFGK